MNDEEISFRIVRLYFEEIARMGFKRSLDLDQMINAYFYTLKKLEGKEAAMRKLTEKVVREEKTITSKEIPSAPVQETKTVTTTTVSVEPKRGKSIADIIEGK